MTLTWATPTKTSGRILLAFFLSTAALLSSAAAQSGDSAQQAIEFFNKGQDAHEKGELIAAVGLYRKAIEIIDEFPEAELQLGNALVALKRLDEAEAAYRSALRHREDWTLAMASLGSLLVDRGKFEEAEKLLDSALAADDGNSIALSALADLRLRTNAGDSALRDVLARLNVLAGKARPTAQILSAKAAVEYKLKLFGESRASAARALEADPGLVSAKIVSAEVAIAENDVELAEKYVGQLEAQGAPPGQTKILKARTLLLRGKNQDALSLLESIASPDQAAKDLISNIKANDVSDPAILLDRLKRDPNDVIALSRLCQGYRVSDPAKALEFCQRASAVEPNELSHAVGVGAALVQAKRYEEAVVLFRKLLTIAPEHATIRANLATALFQLKRYPEAKLEFRWLTEKRPDSAAAFYFLGISHDQLSEFMDALANYQQFLRLADPEADKLEIEKVNLRLPAVQKLIKSGKGKKRE
ncbi:MAG: tetratricopeptide repeat protein [Pyrinomonadaceae bacterium]